MVKKVIVLAALAVSLVVPTTASASTFTQELKASNRAEQKLQNRYPGYSVYAVCDKQGRRFWCTVGGSRRSCFVTGHAWVYRYPWRVRLVGVTRDCF